MRDGDGEGPSLSLSYVGLDLTFFGSIPDWVVNLWKPHARREGAARSDMVRVLEEDDRRSSARVEFLFCVLSRFFFPLPTARE